MNAQQRSETARKVVRSQNWVKYQTPETGWYASETVYLDPTLIAPLRQLKGWTRKGVGKELVAHYQRYLLTHGHPCDDPSQVELFLTLSKTERLPVHIAVVDVDVYFSSTEILPYDAWNE